MSGFKGLKDFRKKQAKSNIEEGFADPTNWISTGNYALNYLLTRNVNFGFPNKKSTLIWGPQGSGKSYIMALAAKDAQTKGYHVIWIDTEMASESSFMERSGVSMHKDDLSHFPINTVEDVNETLSNLFKNIDKADKIMVIVDSLSAMVSDKINKDFMNSNMKGDQGQKAKKIKSLVQIIGSFAAKRDMVVAYTGQAYENPDIMNGKGTHLFVGGSSVEHYPSTVCFLKKVLLKSKTDKSIVNGVVIRGELKKARYSAIGTKIELNVPSLDGIDPLDGLVDLAEDLGLITKNGAWYKFIDSTGAEKSFYAKDFHMYYKEVMADEFTKTSFGMKKKENVEDAE